MSYNLTDLSTALGAYAREHTGEILRNRLFNPMSKQPGQPLTFHDVIRKRFFKDEQAFARTKVDIQVKQTSSIVTEQPNPAVNIEGDLRKLYDFQSVFPLAPYDLENTWIDEVDSARQERKFRQQPALPDVEFVPWLIDHLVGEFLSKVFEIPFFNGVHVPGFDYVNNWPAAFDGVIKYVLDKVTGGDITNVVATGAITSANAYASLEAIGKGAPSRSKNVPQYLVCSELISDWYNDDFEATNPGKNQRLHPEFKRYTLRNRPNITILPHAELNGSGVVFMAPKDTFSFNQDYRGEGPQLLFAVKDTRNIQVDISHSAGISADALEDITVNDQIA